MVQPGLDVGSVHGGHRTSAEFRRGMRRARAPPPRALPGQRDAACRTAIAESLGGRAARYQRPGHRRGKSGTRAASSRGTRAADMLGQHLCPPGVHEEDRVPGRQEPDGRLGLRIREQPVRDVESSVRPRPGTAGAPGGTTALTGETFIPRKAAMSATDAGPRPRGSARRRQVAQRPPGPSSRTDDLVGKGAQVRATPIQVPDGGPAGSPTRCRSSSARPDAGRPAARPVPGASSVRRPGRLARAPAPPRARGSPEPWSPGRPTRAAGGRLRRGRGDSQPARPHGSCRA